MFHNRSSIASALESFRLEERMLCYNDYIPRLYNWCLTLGFASGKIMPSRAFCSDESQGFPIILLTKHFGAFPFNHGRVGGIVSVDRHEPHAAHGQDLLLLQASHVGYDAGNGLFGAYRRLHTADAAPTCNCGKIEQVIAPYIAEYRYARDNILLVRHTGRPALQIDNLLLSRTRTHGLFLATDHLIDGAVDRILPAPLASRSTSNIYPAAGTLIARLGESAWPDKGDTAIGERLAPEDFYYQREWGVQDSVPNQLEYNLCAPMPWVVTSKHPLLTAACANTQAEFDRTYRSLVQSPVMGGKNLLFLAGLNIDISPDLDESFPLTKFVPWAAYVQLANGHREVLEQDEVLERLRAQSPEHPEQLDLEQAIAQMSRRGKITVRL